MGFFSVIGQWIGKTPSRPNILYEAAQKGPEELRSALKAIIDEHWARLNEFQIAQLHRATGAALTTWALMEERLIMIASLLLRSEPQKVGLVFYSIINFQVWIALITELFGMETDYSVFQRRWNKIYERLRAEKDNRDRLAHNAAVSEDQADPLRKTVKKASRYDTRAKSRSFAPMDTESVIQFGERIAALGDDLFTLVEDMANHRTRAVPDASQDKSSAPVPDQRA
jgi:hypothetical protein